MKKRSKIAIGVSAATVGVAAVLLGANFTLADSSGTTLADRIATKFNLNKSDVQAVFDTYKSEKTAERQADKSARLQALVDKGTITADQKAKIEAKQAELKTARESERTALEKWATDNGIDAKYFKGGGPKNETDSTRLQALVNKGTITADQKAKIEAKQAELKTARESERTALEKWASDNGIDAKYLKGDGFGMRGHGGPME